VKAATKRPMPKGGNITREEKHARRLAAAYRKFDEQLPAILEKLTDLLTSDNTSPGVAVQLVTTLERALAYMPPREQPDGSHMDALRAARALNRVMAHPEEFVIQPVELAEKEAELARYDKVCEDLRQKIEEARRLQAEYHDLRERRPLGEAPNEPAGNDAES